MLAEATKLTNAAIASYAKRVGEAHDIYRDGWADIDGLVSRLGGEVKFAESGESLHIRDAGDFTIFVPQFTSKSRDRFTIAHELGHYFLHYRYANLVGEATFYRGARSRPETEANVFAAALLMPAGEFERVWRLNNGDEWEAARHFGVSPIAAQTRAKVLHIPCQ